MMSKSQEQPFKMPQQVLNTLNEVSAGGFLLFFIDDQGSVLPHFQADSEIHALAIQNFSENFIAALKHQNIGEIVAMFQSAAEGLNSDPDDFNSEED
jgi:hypothetical protein